MKKKILATFLSAALILSALAGCNGASDSGSSSTKSSTASSSTEVDASKPNESSDTTETNTEFSYPMDGTVTLTYWCALNPNVAANYTSLGETPFGIELQKRTGINIEFQHPPTGQTNEQFNVLVASQDLPDIVEYDWLNEYPGGPEKAITDKTIYKLNDILDQYSPNLSTFLAERPEIDKMVRTDEGSYYVYPFIRDGEDLLTNVGAFMRQDWLEELNLEIPTTVDDWHEVLTAFKNEKGAIAPLSYQYSDNSTQTQNNPIAYAYGTTSTWFVGKDGTVHYGPYDDNFKDFLQTYSQWYAEGLIDPDIATLTSEQIDAKMTSGEAGACIGWAGGTIGSMLTAMANDPTYALVAVPYPTLEEGAYPEMGHIDNAYVTPTGCAAISLNCENVEAAARLLDYGYSEEGRMYYNFGVEGVSYEMDGDTPTYTSDMYENPNGWSFAQALAANIRANSSGPFPQDNGYISQYLRTETQRNAYKTWLETNAADYKLPPITPTAEESEEFAIVMNEVDTYVQEMMLKYILGIESLDNYGDYQATLKQFGIEKAIEIQNAAYKRYNAR